MSLTAYVAEGILAMPWTVRVAAEFVDELAALSASVRIELLAQARVIERFGPQTGRPRVDTIKGSRYANMKELRFDTDGGVWWVAFAFDTRRDAILLAAGDKSGRNEARFYRQLITRAEQRFAAHLSRLRAEANRS
jgi:hypothetical protein